MSPPPLSRAEKLVLSCYILWMLIGLVVTLAQITPGTVMALALPGTLQSFILGCLHWGDPVSIMLAAINTHWMACRTWGTLPARKWTVLVLAISALTESIGTLTGWPFGLYHYTDNFGPRVAGILPLAIPFSWLVLVTNVLFLVRTRDYLRPWQESLWVATGVTFLDWIMEPFAVHLKAYWLWESATVPWQNYVSWFGLTFLLVSRFAPAPKLHHPSDFRPLIILGAMFGLFICARLRNGV
jgi:putative membrane protein